MVFAEWNCIAGLAIACVRVWDGMFGFFNLAELNSRNEWKWKWVFRAVNSNFSQYEYIESSIIIEQDE